MPYKDKEEQRKASAKHYQLNKEKVKQRAKDFKKENWLKTREFVNKYLLEHPCIDCGEKDIIVLEFDHVRGVKNKSISRMLIDGFSIKSIVYEISKCEVRCANCHRRVTYSRRLNGDKAQEDEQ